MCHSIHIVAHQREHRLLLTMERNYFAQLPDPRYALCLVPRCGMPLTPSFQMAHRCSSPVNTPSHKFKSSLNGPSKGRPSFTRLRLVCRRSSPLSAPLHFALALPRRMVGVSLLAIFFKVMRFSASNVTSKI